jgi:hypothetical protein
MTTTLVRIEPQTRIKTKLAENLDLFRNMLEVGMPLREIARYFSKELLVEMLVHQTDKRELTAVTFDTFEEVEYENA